MEEDFIDLVRKVVQEMQGTEIFQDLLRAAQSRKHWVFERCGVSRSSSTTSIHRDLIMMATDKTLAPEVLWAQRTDELFVTINLSDVEDPKIELTNEQLSVSGRSRGGAYAVTFPFFKEVNPDESKQSVTARNISLVIAKKEKGQEYWPRLMKEKTKTHWLKTDFSKWKDEDEDDEVAAPGFGDMDLSQFQGMGGMGGMPGMGGMEGLGGMGGMGGMNGMDFGAAGMDFSGAPQDSDDEEEDAPSTEPATDASA